ncbi:TPA: thioredoxin-disulfide reductase [Candidatus Uhrbacteria bacterium]|uniref:Thioredoxin reductase n=2 Tax=Candidatus Uhriibacteriota TaxID=1752732 RepID=A0A0G1Q6R1_9BACT|nr:MAG: Thioredoxin reductase [Candidatus Uhrbacteria bacterium GW2011_GWF2_46_218]KKU40736.1 MAG: Thioredoxin reductase [Candidatus Uhrbacteria bacterium GW2011_GWE2_46_68]HBK33580.1 thioredoxin-disulfide reductase [Candidatus Uhrbacteria bacterium]HCB19705.1 thioredoxin-disulfide reductase [Candidatus Uhrbacteria bacterium]
MEARHVIILGSGPAGYTAAIYTARAGLKPLVFAGPQRGGQLMWTTEVENFPGFPEGVMGPELMDRMRKQAERFGAEIVDTQVASVNLSSHPFVVSAGEDAYESQALIIATGASARWLGVLGEEQYKGKGVSACATCDGFFFRGKDVVIVGGGDAALEEATFLTKFATHVTILVRGEALRASKPLQERARGNEKITFLYYTQVEEVLGDGVKVTGVKIKNSQTQEISELSVGGLFVSIGHQPNTGMFEGQLELTKGFIVRKPDTSLTSVPGVFVAGDVADWNYQQAITAAGLGCMAAMDCEEWLASQE